MGRPFGRCAQLAWDDSLTGSGEPWPFSSKALSVEQGLAYSFPPDIGVFLEDVAGRRGTRIRGRHGMGGLDEPCWRSLLGRDVS